jgi:hypothetical protein
MWLLATAGDEAVGALTGVVWGDRGRVGELGVLAPWRGRGIASALLRPGVRHVRVPRAATGSAER